MVNRRGFLQSAAIGTLSTVAGCLYPGAAPSSPASVSEIATGYPLFSAAYYDVTATRVFDPEDAPVAFDDLPGGARLELANAVGRDRYVVGRPPELLSADLHRAVLSYRGSTFEVRIGVGDRFSEPTHGPDGDPDWVEPVDPVANVDGSELTITIANALDTGLAVHHVGRPYLGVIVAVGESPSVLDHDYYVRNEHIDASGVVTTAEDPADAWETQTLSPGGSLRETYVVPDDRPDESTVWFAIPIGDESTELFGNRSTLLTATISLQA